MGYRPTLEMVIIVNAIACLFFFIQSFFMVSSSRHSLNIVRTIKQDEDTPDYKEGMNRLWKKRLIGQTPLILKSKVKWFFYFSLGILILFCFSTMLRYKIMSKTLEKQMSIFNTYEHSQKGTTKVNANDSLSWNYLHVLEQVKKDDQNSVFDDSVKAFSADQENLLEVQYQYPRLWAFIYTVGVALFTRYSVKFYSSQGQHLETVIRCHSQYEFSHGKAPA